MSEGLSQPQQERSRKALDRLVNASIDLMSAGSFDDAPITEIIKKADCSVGAFYARFEGKDALFHLVQERVLEEAREWLDQQFDDFHCVHDQTGRLVQPKDVAAFIVRTLYGLYTRRSGAYRAVFLHTRVKRDEALTQKVHAFNACSLKRAAELFSKVNPSKSRASKRRRWSLGLEVLSAYLREKILFGDVIPTGKRHAVEKDLAELEKMYLSYVIG